MPSVLPTPPHSDIVGRTEQWHVLQARCQRARSGAGGIIWLVGELGIGKTALMDELRAWACSEGYRTLAGRHIGHRQAPPLHGLREALIQLLDIAPGDPPAIIEGKVNKQLAQHWPGLELHNRSLIHFIEPLVAEAYGDSIDENTAQYPHLYHLFYRLFTTVAQERPLLFFLDDFHWADATTLDYLQYLAPLLSDHPILFIISYRPEETESLAALKNLRFTPNSDALPIPRLRLKDTELMIERAGLAPDENFGRKLHQLTEGVPLFINLWLLDIAKVGQATERALTHCPQAISQAIGRRLQSLMHHLQTLVQAAAVGGDCFSAELLHRIDGRPLTDILDQLAELEERYYLFQSTATAMQERPYTFSHQLIRQIIYDAIPLGRKQQLHARAGVAMEELVSFQPDLVFEVSQHYIAARQGEQAAAILYRAGRRAHAAGAPRDAHAYYEQALEVLAGHSSEQRTPIQEALGDACLATDDIAQARELWEKTLALQPDALGRARLYLKLGQSWRHSDFGRQWHYHQKGLEATHAHPNSVERAQILVELMLIADPAQPGSARDKKRIASQAGEALRILRHHPRRDVLAHMLTHRMAMVFVSLGDHRNGNIARKNRLFRRAIRLAESIGNWELAIEGHMRQAEVWQSANLQKALELSEAALALAERYLSPQHQRIEHIVRRILHWSFAAGDQQRIDLYCSRLDLQPGQPIPHLEPYQWQTHARQAWDFHLQQAHQICRQFVVAVRLVKHLTKLQRLAHCQLGPEIWRQFIEHFPQEHPGYFASLAPIQWDLFPVDDEATAMPLAEQLGIDDLVWFDQMRTSHYQRINRETIEITPGPGVGLGWSRMAPGIVRPVDGNFNFAVRICCDSHPRSAGGIVVWDQEGHLIRLGRGIDHEGQVSLAWHDGQQLRYAGASYFAEKDIYLRLTRSGRQYAGYISTDGKNWLSCGALRFGDDGPIKVGLFAESGYEYDIPQPFPIRFSEISLWVDAPAKRAAVPPTAKISLYPLPEPPEPFYGMIGYHRVFAEFRRQLEEVAHSSLPLLIVGESGTGKELAAQAVHLLSHHGESPYIPLNVAALPEGLVESELFGHKRGSFTGATRDQAGLFAAAATGSIFLDEIGELPLEIQARLLRVLDSGEIRPLGSSRILHVKARIIAATNRDLGRAVHSGRFRQDLYFRFADPLVIPPLRERREDIPHLVAFFLALYGQGVRYSITHEAMRQLEVHPWPDNIRGLKHVLERAVLAATKAQISTEHLSLRSPTAHTPPIEGFASKRKQTGRHRIPTPEELRQITSDYKGNVAAISRHFNVSRLTIYRWLERNNIDIEKLRQQI